MRKFALKIIAFSIIVTLCVWGIDTFLNAQMKQLKYEDASVWNDIYKGQINAEILVCGSSRAATHIDSRMIATHTGNICYNLGMMGHNFYIQDARYAVYLQHNLAPKLIILSLDFESLQKRKDLFNHTQFLAYLNDSIIARATKQYEGFSKYDYQFPLLKYVGEQTLIFSLIKNKVYPKRNKEDRFSGFYPRDYTWDKHVDAILDTLKPFVVKNDSVSIHAFERFLNDCKFRKIQIVFVNTPVHICGQKKAINGAEMMNVFKNYAQQYQIPFYNYAQDSICNEQKYFMNSTHLNKVGAAFFTRKLIEDLDKDSLLNLP